MSAGFADTFYFFALLDTREASHARASLAWRDPQLRLVTTEWVLAEFGNAYCHPNDRADFVALYRALVGHARVLFAGGREQGARKQGEGACAFLGRRVVLALA